MVTNPKIERKKIDIARTLEKLSEVKGRLREQKQDLLKLEKDALTPFSKQLSNLTLQALNSGHNPIQEIIGFMKCPNCGKDFEYVKTPEEEYIFCGEHRFDINDGVVDFKTLEIPGYTWSSWIRRYEDYKKRYENYDLTELKETDKNIIQELQKHKPPVILDIGSGSASGVRKFMNYIDWECTIILTDLSHRILKYDKRYIDENTINPQVKIVCFACDVRNLPFKDDTILFVLSYGGYFCISYGLKKSFTESRRVLIPGGRTITDMGIVSDRENQNVQKWLNLIKKEIGHDGDMMDEYYRSIYDMKEWDDLIKEFGFADFTFIKIKDEIPAPETDMFPYDCEISRWMGMAFITAVK